MKNMYDGNVTTDGSGLATALPDWFEALNNRDFRHQLTVIGQFAQAIVVRRSAAISSRTDKPNVKVFRQVTGIRAFARTPTPLGGKTAYPMKCLWRSSWLPTVREGDLSLKWIAAAKFAHSIPVTRRESASERRRPRHSDRFAGSRSRFRAWNYRRLKSSNASSIDNLIRLPGIHHRLWRFRALHLSPLINFRFGTPCQTFPSFLDSASQICRIEQAKRRQRD